MNDKKVISHKVLFVIACVILAVTIAVFLLSMMHLPSSSAPPDQSESNSIGALLGAVTLVIVDILAIVATLLLCSVGWGAGMIISVYLAFYKKDMPRRLRIGSVILAVIFTVLVICSLAYFGTILIKIGRFSAIA